jgi:hypothetical protein
MLKLPSTNHLALNDTSVRKARTEYLRCTKTFYARLSVDLRFKDFELLNHYNPTTLRLSWPVHDSLGCKIVNVVLVFSDNQKCIQQHHPIRSEILNQKSMENYFKKRRRTNFLLDPCHHGQQKLLFIEGPLRLKYRCETSNSKPPQYRGASSVLTGLHQQADLPLMLWEPSLQ